MSAFEQYTYYTKKYDISSPQFTDYFSEQIKNLTQEQRNDIPKDLKIKIKIDSEDGYTHTIYNLLQQLYVLYRVLNKRCYIVVEDEENGISVDEFLALDKEKFDKVNDENAKKLYTKAAFILGARDLINSFHYLNLLSYSPAYSYFLKLKNIRSTKYHHQEQSVKYICNLISMYEGRKKLITRNLGITTPEWYVMLLFADGMERGAAFAYKDRYHNAYNSSRKQISVAIKKLVDKGILQRFSKNKGATYILTPYGFDKLFEILGKYVVNY